MKKVDRETPVPDQQYMKKIFQVHSGFATDFHLHVAEY